jgi:hypothetical protein
MSQHKVVLSLSLLVLFSVTIFFLSSSSSSSLPPLVATREELVAVLEERGFESGAELGIQHGGFAAHNLKYWTRCKLYVMVDVWKSQPNYMDSANVDDAGHQEAYEQAMRKIEPWKDKVTVLRMLTAEAAQQIADESLDFLYLDARHDYCGVQEDLALWWPKLKVGGMLAGHDYLTAAEVRARDAGQDWSVCADGSRHEQAVKGAVDEFAAVHGLGQIRYTEEAWPSWYLFK